MDARRKGQRGAATVLVVAMAGLVLFIGCALSSAAALVVDHRRAQSAADLAALAGAGAFAQGADGCAAAGINAAENDADLVVCQQSGRAVQVTVSVDGPVLLGRATSLEAVARAGPESG